MCFSLIRNDEMNISLTVEIERGTASSQIDGWRSETQHEQIALETKSITESVMIKLQRMGESVLEFRECGCGGHNKQ